MPFLREGQLPILRILICHATHEDCAPRKNDTHTHTGIPFDPRKHHGLLLYKHSYTSKNKPRTLVSCRQTRHRFTGQWHRFLRNHRFTIISAYKTQKSRDKTHCAGTHAPSWNEPQGRTQVVDHGSYTYVYVVQVKKSQPWAGKRTPVAFEFGYSTRNEATNLGEKPAKESKIPDTKPILTRQFWSYCVENTLTIRSLNHDPEIQRDVPRKVRTHSCPRGCV